jgi:hypothetical protein
MKLPAFLIALSLTACAQGRPVVVAAVPPPVVIGPPAVVVGPPPPVVVRRPVFVDGPVVVAAPAPRPVVVYRRPPPRFVRVADGRCYRMSGSFRRDGSWVPPHVRCRR